MSHPQMFIDEGLAGLLLCWVERVYLSNLRDKGVLEFDGMIERAIWGKDIVGLFREYIGKGRTEAGDRDVLWFISLGKLGRDGDFIDLFVCSSSPKAILTERPVIFNRRKTSG